MHREDFDIIQNAPNEATHSSAHDGDPKILTWACHSDIDGKAKS